MRARIAQTPAKMFAMGDLPKLSRAPEISSVTWLNTPSPISMRDLRGNIVLLDMWDYSCINCLRTVPYLRTWYERYHQFGLSIVGIHTPEFSFALDDTFVSRAVEDLGIQWPIALDNDQAVWTAYANRYWPTIYLIDTDGYVRERHVGDRGYAQLENKIQHLLYERDHSIDLPSPSPAQRLEDEPSAVCYPTTPELHAQAVGNIPQPTDLPLLQRSPSKRVSGFYYVEGTWRFVEDGITNDGMLGTIYLPYEAASVYAVLSPTYDRVTLALRLEKPIEVEIKLDGKPLADAEFGIDVHRMQKGAIMVVDTPRLYHLISHESLIKGELSLHIASPGLTVFAFSFGTCIVSGSDHETLGESLATNGTTFTF